MKCDYYGCKGKATKEIKTQVNETNNDTPHTISSYNTTLHVCEKCYKEYLEAME